MEDALHKNAEVVGNLGKDLVINTFGKIYIRVKDRYYNLNFKDSQSNEGSSEKKPDLIILSSETDITTLPYPGDGKIIFTLDGKIYITQNGSYINFNLKQTAANLEIDDLTVNNQITVKTASKPPFVIRSSALVKNLNAELLGGYSASDFTKREVNEEISGNWTIKNILYVDNVLKSTSRRESLDPTNLDFNTSSLDIDYINVRKALRVYQYIINTINCTNGSFWVSDSAKINKLSELSEGFVWYDSIIDSVKKDYEFGALNNSWHTEEEWYNIYIPNYTTGDFTPLDLTNEDQVEQANTLLTGRSSDGTIVYPLIWTKTQELYPDKYEVVSIMDFLDTLYKAFANIPRVLEIFDGEVRAFVMEDTASSGLTSFWVNDVIRCQKVQDYNTYNFEGVVTKIDNLSIWVKFKGPGTITNLVVGDTFVRIDNVIHPDRRGAIYLTSSDYKAPYMDVIDNTEYVYNNNKKDEPLADNSNIKIRIGRLDGLGLDPIFGRMKGMGAYFNGNVFIKGRLVQRSPNPDLPDVPVTYPRGEYSDLDCYYWQDEVTYQGSTYRRKEKGDSDGCITGISPSNSDWWLKLTMSGQPAKWIEIDYTSNVFKYSEGSTNPEPSSITLEVIPHNIEPTYQWYKDGIQIVGATEKTYTITSSEANAWTTKLSTFKCVASYLEYDDLKTAQDEVTIAKLEDGASGQDAYTILLSNESITVPATSDGTVVNTGDIYTDIYVYKGTAKLDYPSQYTISSSSPYFGGVSVTEEGNARVKVLESFKVHPLDYTVVTLIISSKVDTNIEVSKLWTIAKAKQGYDGAIGRPLVYRGMWDATAKYYSTDTRVDAVKYQTGTNEGQPVYSHFIAKKGNDSTTNINHVPTDTEWWDPFGAEFDSIATGLLLADNANIAGLTFYDNKLFGGYLSPSNYTFRLDGDINSSTSGLTILKGNIKLGPNGDGTYKIELNDDGSGRLANGNINWSGSTTNITNCNINIGDRPAWMFSDNGSIWYKEFNSSTTKYAIGNDFQVLRCNGNEQFTTKNNEGVSVITVYTYTCAYSIDGGNTYLPWTNMSYLTASTVRLRIIKQQVATTVSSREYISNYTYGFTSSSDGSGSIAFGNLTWTNVGYLSIKSSIFEDKISIYSSQLTTSIVVYNIDNILNIESNAVVDDNKLVLPAIADKYYGKNLSISIVGGSKMSGTTTLYNGQFNASNFDLYKLNTIQNISIGTLLYSYCPAEGNLPWMLQNAIRLHFAIAVNYTGVITKQYSNRIYNGVLDTVKLTKYENGVYTFSFSTPFSDIDDYYILATPQPVYLEDHPEVDLWQRTVTIISKTKNSFIVQTADSSAAKPASFVILVIDARLWFN